MTGALGTQQRAAGAPAGPTTRSLLVVDCGSVFTKVALLGQVDGRYRMLAATQTPTTSVPPHADILQGILAGIAELEQICTRVLLRDGRVLTPEQENGDGVDGMAVTVSVGGPLRLLTAGPGREALAALVHRATGGLFAALEPLPMDVDVPSAAGTPPEWERHLARLRTLRPHAVLVVGNALEGQRGRPDLEETGRALAALIDSLRAAAGESGYRLDLPVVFAGLPADAVALEKALAGRAVLQTLDPLSPNTLAPLSRSVAGLYENAVLRAIPGYDRVRTLGAIAAGAVETSLAGMARGLAQHYQMNVVGVDVGASSTLVIGATASGHVLPAAHPEAGVGPGLGAILRAVGASGVTRWIAGPIEESEVREYALKRMLRPRLLPAAARELELEHAFAREAILLAMRAPGSTVAGLQPMDVVLGTGGVLAHAPRPSDAALLLLDAIQPGGITSIVLDSAQLAGMLGGLSAIDAAASGEVAESDAVVARLGSVVSTVGSVQPGHAAVRVVLEYADGRRHVADVPQGNLVRLPLHYGERAHLSLYPASTVDIGLGPGQQARASEPIDGGLLGLIVDARGRPLTLPQNDEERWARLREWRQAMETVA